MAFWERGGWVKRVTYLGKNKEVFDAEVFAILRAARLLIERGEEGGGIPSSRTPRLP